MSFFAVRSGCSLTVFHVVHDRPNLGFARLATHRKEHRANHVFVDGWVLGELAFKEPSRTEETSDESADEGEDDE